MAKWKAIRGRRVVPGAREQIIKDRGISLTLFVSPSSEKSSDSWSASVLLDIQREDSMTNWENKKAAQLVSNRIARDILNSIIEDLEKMSTKLR